MLKKFRADLHIHTCLSPCGSLSMVPGVIVEEARKRRLDVIGICDHNATENVRAVRKAAQKEKVAVLGGMEVTTAEEVHVLALFDEDERLFELQTLVYENLPRLEGKPSYGEQVIVNENDEVVDVNGHLLMGATGLPLEVVVERIRSLSGLAIASHVDREGFGILGQLGFVPEGLRLDAVEISPKMTADKARSALPQVSAFPLVAFSDAHFPEEIGRRCTTFVVEDVRIEEIRNALLSREGRSVLMEQ
jgi:hypothetical protein